MKQAVLISINPKWCELIASGKKTIEVRKTKPKLLPPFKCYIYCTLKGSREFFETYLLGDIAEWNRGKWWNKKGKVIGEFVCDKIIDWHYIPDPDESSDPGSMAYDVLTVDGEKTGLEYDDFEDYGKGAPLYGWHITDLKLYAEPKEINEFKRWNRTEQTAPCAHVYALYSPCESCTECNLKSAPQSWCYVEEVDE